MCGIGQIYVPPYGDCGVVFMQQIMSGIKKVSSIVWIPHKV